MTEAEQLEGFLSWDAEELSNPDSWLAAWDFAAPKMDQWSRADKTPVSFFKVIQEARDIQEFGDYSDDSDFVGYGFAAYVGYEDRDRYRGEAAKIVKGMWDYFRRWGYDAIMEYAMQGIERTWGAVRSGTRFYVSLSPRGLLDLMRIGMALESGVADINEAASAAVSVGVGEGKSPRAVYFNLYYLARVTGDPVFAQLAKAVSKYKASR